jgi:multidrug efflux pump subunit AcrB
MNLTDFSLKNPYSITAVVLVVAALGGFAFLRTPTDLFPNTIPPQVIVVTVRPGANADDMADKVSEVLEKELNTLSGLKKVGSTSRDEVSAVNAEFHYEKPIGEALLDVQNAVARIRARLPGDILEPRIYRITDATRPLLTLALSPKPGSTRTLTQIRLLAENEIQDRILAIAGIADVDVFGGHQPELKIHIDRDRLAGNGVSVDEIIGVLARQNVSAPAGTIYSQGREYLARITGEFTDLQQIREIPLRKTERGVLRLQDVASVTMGEREQRSIYHGNGQPAIALNVLRPDRGPTMDALRQFKQYYPELQAAYPDIEFQITDDQQPLIDLNIAGMRQSLLQAIILTVIVIFVFLADFRAALIVSVSIPLAFLASLTVLWFSPYTLNMVTLSGLIISVGLVVDASVVVLENIHRHYTEMEEPDALEAARRGAREIALPTAAGMLTTVVVLVPVMFSGGYSQQTMRPLNIMITSTLAASLAAALTVVPLMAAKLYARRHRRSFVERWFGATDKVVDLLAGFYLAVLRGALRWWFVTLPLAAAFFVLSLKIVPPLIGGELMPPMDTGIATIQFETPADYAPSEVEKVLNDVEQIIYRQEAVETVSAVVGSEPGEISFGGGGATAQSARITVHLTDRLHREQTIWEIEDQWRADLARLAGVRSFRVSEYGATPVSTTRAPLDIVISGPDPEVASRLADQCLEALQGLPGLIDVRRSWFVDKPENEVVIDPSLARLYQTSPQQIAQELKTYVKGVPASQMRLKGFLDIPITVQYDESYVQDPASLQEAYISSQFGPLPLRSIATFRTQRRQPFITRERLANTLDITGVNRIYTIGQVAKMAQKRLAKLHAPEGYKIEVSGTMADMKTGQQEMGSALMIGFVLLYILLVAIFKSFRHPVTVMAAIPLAVAGALWGLLLFDKPMCKPATMGMILLGGTVVNNSILLLDFILSARAQGLSKQAAIMQAVRLRIRPILMTTVSTVVGLTPLVLELAIGLERMSPLGIVAATGLIVGTFLTMVVIPVFYSVLDSLAESAGAAWRFLTG